MHLNDYDRLKFEAGARLGPPPIMAEPEGASGLARGMAGLGLAVTGMLLAGRRWLRLRRERGQAQAVDREDLALIRTARDALVYLLRKRFARFKVVSLNDFQGRRRRPGRGWPRAG